MIYVHCRLLILKKNDNVFESDLENITSFFEQPLKIYVTAVQRAIGNMVLA